MKNKLYILAAVLLAIGVSSCYKIISAFVPEEVVAGDTFTATLTVADDGDSNQKFIDDWSLAGIRVPEGWTVKMQAGSYRAYAEDWVYLEDGSKADKKYAMAANEKLTDFYNSACPKNGYTWYGFQSRTKIPKFVSACWRNGCDSISVSFKVTVPTDCKPGTYTIDFIAGDVEDEAGIDYYASYTDAKDTRVFHVGTFNNAYLQNKYTAFQRKVTVVADPSGISEVKDDEKECKVYTIDGKRVGRNAKKNGLYIVNGKKKEL